MPASKKGLSEAEIKQRSEAGQASKVHGAYAYQARGDQALEPNKRGRLAELAELASDRAGLISLLQERVTRSIMMCEIIESYIVQEKQLGKSLADIPILGKLPAYQNSAQRAIASLVSLLPKSNEDALDAKNILEAVKRGQKDE
jgi:hypothetical protein